MDFNEWKEEYKKRRENIRKEKKGLVGELTEIVSQVEKNVAEMGKIVAIYPDYSMLLKGDDWDKATDLLKASGFNNLNDLNGKWSERSIISEELAKKYRNTINHIYQLKAEENEEFVFCPECKGVGYKTDRKIVGETIREIVFRLRQCTQCNGRGRVPTRELLDC
ncbi:MAG: hypothetical protein ABSF44_06695 [Candidatus Bathyarchaeia archaeon]